MPPVPATISDSGLTGGLIEQIILKVLYFRGEVIGRELAQGLGFRFSVIEDLLDTLKRNQLIQVKRSLGVGTISAQFALTDAGRSHARDHLETNQYVGPAPVPLYQYTYVARRQRPPEGWLTRENLAHAYRRIVMTPEVLSQIGPAVASGNSFLIYGKPGNGKTYLAEALTNVDRSCIYMPYAIESQGMIVQVYDPVYHQIVQDTEVPSIFNDQAFDGRWFKCRRPFIATGGELSLDMLDLCYNSVSKIYEAPFQLKANNGIYLIDDFGRQKASPSEILNRWIVPMERRVDYLTFRTGGKMTVPFEAFLIFSTNLRPDNLGDEAFLRRIQYKMFLRSPKAPEFIQIFERFSAARQLVCPPGLAEQFVQRHYIEGDKRFRRCHPRDVITHAIDILNFERRPMALTEDVLNRAFHSCFVENVDVND